MSAPEELVAQPALDDDGVLEFTQKKRMELVGAMTEGGTMPTDKGDRMVLLAALGDMDKQALVKKKIGSDERGAAEDRRVAAMIAAMSNHFGSTSPFEAPADKRRLSDAPVLNTIDMEPLQTVPGETAQGIEYENSDSFMARMEGTELPSNSDEGSQVVTVDNGE